MSDPPGFLFVTCQVGAEAALKSEVARRWPEFRFAYSRPGFVTFKLPKDHSLPADFDLEAVFARAHAFSLGKVTGDDLETLAAGCVATLGQPAGQEAARLGAGQGVARGARLRALDHAGRDRRRGGDRASSVESPESRVRSRESRVEGQGSRVLALSSRLSALDFPGEHGARLRAGRAPGVVGRVPPGPLGPVAVARRDDAPGVAARRGLPGVAEDGGGPAVVAVADPVTGPGVRRSAALRAERARRSWPGGTR